MNVDLNYCYLIIIIYRIEIFYDSVSFVSDEINVIYDCLFVYIIVDFFCLIIYLVNLCSFHNFIDFDLISYKYWIILYCSIIIVFYDNDLKSSINRLLSWNSLLVFWLLLSFFVPLRTTCVYMKTSSVFAFVRSLVFSTSSLKTSAFSI